jgi:hypothetical protein
LFSALFSTWLESVYKNPYKVTEVKRNIFLAVLEQIRSFANASIGVTKSIMLLVCNRTIPTSLSSYKLCCIGRKSFMATVFQQREVEKK